VAKALAKIESERKKSELVEISIARDWRQPLGPWNRDPGALERPDALGVKTESGDPEPGEAGKRARC
jgi:hypothetical protein